MSARRKWVVLLAGFVSATVLCAPSAQAQKKKKPPKPTAADTSLEDYLRQVEAAGTPHSESTGSLWTGQGPLAILTNDYKAHNLGDLITVNLVDKFQADNDGENQTSRQASAQSTISTLLGKLKVSNALQNIINGSSATALDGKGQSTMSSDLQLSLGGQVMRVLPNGVLVIEATRDFTVGNDRQTVVVRGLVRPGDIAPNNTIASTSISNIELEIKGKGEVADAARRPYLPFRIIEKILTF